ncbi:hypothetical protein [Sphingomonas sp.]|uniref:hypothetical protein n=1 Tax=Sphingomonas sp. TaxID=28214 RepID=UPI003B002666
MLRLFVTAAVLIAPTLAVAQSAPPQRIRNVQLQHGQPCPPASVPGEVVVCSTLEEPYRIPKALRDDAPVAAANQSWVNRAADIDQTSRVQGGLPDTCSVVGNGGQTGCAQAAARAWAADRRAGNVPGR